MSFAYALAQATDVEVLATLNNPSQPKAVQRIECNCTNKCAPERMRGAKPFEICIDYCQKLIEADVAYKQDLLAGHTAPQFAALH